jgi:hypothetical protein
MTIPNITVGSLNIVTSETENLDSSKPRLSDFAAYAHIRHGDYLLYSIAFELGAWLIPLLLVVLVILLRLQWNFMFFAAIPVGLVIPTIFRSSRRLAKRYRIDPQKTLLQDTRPPILFLRSFKDDSIENSRPPRQKAPEELLVPEYDRIGPVVAVGKPGELLPLIGAVRLYFNNEEWQFQVSRLMSISNLVLFQVGNSKGLEWEISNAKHLLSPEQLIFSFVAWHDLEKADRQFQYEVFREQAEKLIGCSLPGSFNNAYFLYFDREWNHKLVYVNINIVKKFFLIDAAKTYVHTAVKQIRQARESE